MLYDNLGVNERGHLTFAGCDTLSLCKKYGTPLMLIDEERLRNNARTILSAVKEYFGDDSKVLLASKALCFKEIYRIANAEGLCTDLVSTGEMYTALQAGFPLEKAYFHGNGKSLENIRYALDNKLGYFVVDNKEEIDRINSEAKKRGVKQKVLLRLTPGIDPHTHAKISTGKVDSKFGMAIETGQAEKFVKYVLSLENIALEGFHCHIGSQIFEIEPYVSAAKIMLDFIALVKESFGVEIKNLNLGGGFGVRYLESDPKIDYRSFIANIAVAVREKCRELNITKPAILFEPGRSIVANAGMTLYTVESVKSIKGYKNYATIDGGMTDNPRYALYQSGYTVINATKADKEPDYVCTVAGCCCESGDLIQEDVFIKRPLKNDNIAVLCTGAYNYAMASNYNKVPRPPIVMISGGKDRVVVRRETMEDLAAYDV